MRLGTILIFLLCIRGTAISQATLRNQYTIKGNLSGKDTGYVYLYYNSDKGGKVDSARLLKGRFVLRGDISEPMHALISALPVGQLSGTDNCADLFIEPALMQLEVSFNEFRNLRLTGSAADIERMRLVRLKAPIDSMLQPIHPLNNKFVKEYLVAIRNQFDSLRINSLKWKLDSLKRIFQRLFDEESAIDSAFIMSHPNSYVAAYMVCLNINTKAIKFPSLADLYNRFPEAIKNSYYGRKILMEVERDEKLLVGSYARNFVAIDNRGDSIMLGAYKGRKYVLLDFWASWCLPCRAATPILRRAYDKYSNDLEIIGVADQKEEADWLEAINKDGMVWRQIIENTQKKPVEPADSSISASYQICSLPSLILIDKDSKIVEKFGGGFDAKPVSSLESELDLILGAKTKH